MQQQQTEAVTKYHARLEELARTIPGIFNTEEIISVLIAGLRPELGADAKELHPQYKGTERAPPISSDAA